LLDATNDLKTGADGITLTFTGTDKGGHSYGPTTTPPINAGDYVISAATYAHLKLNDESSYQFA
jgi:hypothetical protein